MHRSKRSQKNHMYKLMPLFGLPKEPSSVDDLLELDTTHFFSIPIAHDLTSILPHQQAAGYRPTLASPYPTRASCGTSRAKRLHMRAFQLSMYILCHKQTSYIYIPVHNSTVPRLSMEDVSLSLVGVAHATHGPPRTVSQAKLQVICSCAQKRWALDIPRRGECETK